MAAFYFSNAADCHNLNGRYLFDTNVWLAIQGPYIRPHDRRTSSYSALMKKVIEDGGCLIADPIVIMEFVNAFLKIEFNLIKGENGIPDKFKAFRQTQEYRDLASGVSDDLFHLLQDCEVIGMDFSKERYDEICKELSGGSLDFNDGLIAETCKREDLTLVTDDYDYANCDISIISANRRYRS